MSCLNKRYLLLSIELDEPWHFIKKDKKRWIGKALSYPNRQLLDWVWGKRDKETFQNLYNRLKQRFANALYCVDYWQTDEAVIPEAPLLQGKAVTHTVESNNSDTRHWFCQFHRKSKAVSRLMERVDITLKLQAFRKQVFQT